MLNELEKIILATVVYYDALSLPLRAEEIFACLINPKRLGGRSDFSVEFSDIFIYLSNLKNGSLSGFLESKDGFYFLKNKEQLVSARRERQKISILKWKKAKRALWLLGHVPYVRMVLLAGSVSQDNAKESSDIDILIVSKEGRIWMCRMLATLILSLLKKRRSDRGQMTHELVKDKICLNHYITESSLHIPFHSMYNAQSYIFLVPVVENKKGLFEKFQKENSWIEDYIMRYPASKANHKKILIRKIRLVGPQKVLEGTLEIIGGNFFERKAERIQKKRIEKNMPPDLNRGRIIYNDKFLEFHPSSQEAAILDDYNKKMLKFNINGFVFEKNSGLN